MIQFINAKINIGLHIIRKRSDGYHDLQTIFHPIGLYNGTPRCPYPLCDILEITPRGGSEDIYTFSGNSIDCPLESNLVNRAVQLYRAGCGGEGLPPLHISLEKHIPDGAGLGGGSADASFTLRVLNALSQNPLTNCELETLAARLGADCPVFISNRPAYAEGVGEMLMPVDINLSGRWTVIVKPPFGIPTREAFAGITPRDNRIDLRKAVTQPIDQWKGLIANDFEASLFPNHPELPFIKETLYDCGAMYASMSGSGSAMYGIFQGRDEAEQAAHDSRFLPFGVFIAML